jgi:hypothetical protein
LKVLSQSRNGLAGAVRATAEQRAAEAEQFPTEADAAAEEMAQVLQPLGPLQPGPRRSASFSASRGDATQLQLLYVINMLL